MTSSPTETTNDPQLLEDYRTQYKHITESLIRKRAVLGLDDKVQLSSLRRNVYLRLCMNARALKQRIRDRLQQRKFEIKRLERAYRHTVNGNVSRGCISLLY